MSSSSHNPAYVPGPTFGFVKLLALSGSHCTKWAYEQHRPAWCESRLVPDLPPLIPTLIGLRAFDHVSSRVWWEAATDKQRPIVGPPWTFSEPMYGTRPCCLVQVITRHMCPDQELGSWNCLHPQAHIAPSERMSSIDQQGSSLGSFPTFPSPLSPLKSAFWLLIMCQVVSGGRRRQINRDQQ